MKEKDQLVLNFLRKNKIKKMEATMIDVQQI